MLFDLPPHRVLFPFCFRDPETGKWRCARYVAERWEIAKRYSTWEIVGPPEIRRLDDDGGYFNPDRRWAGA